MAEAKKTTAAKKAPPPKKDAATGDKKAPRERFVPPPKPTPTPTTLNVEDYTYERPGGRRVFFQGYDMAYKSALMRDARSEPATATSKESLAELIRRNWTTPDKEKELREKKAKKKESTGTAKAPPPKPATKAANKKPAAKKPAAAKPAAA